MVSTYNNLNMQIKIDPKVFSTFYETVIFAFNNKEFVAYAINFYIIL